MKKSKLNEKINGPINKPSDIKYRPEYEDLFKKSLEKAFERKVSDEEVKEMDAILSGRSSDDLCD